MLLFFQNYNKSRIHSFRGAKDVIIKLNDITIFDGEIAKASGDDMGSLDSFGDVRNSINDFKLYKKYNFNFLNIINYYMCNV